MKTLKTTYMGMELDSPLIVGSCGLTRNIEGVEKCAQAGAGAVVLKSIFEEVIAHETESEISAAEESLWHPEALQYTRTYARENEVSRYLKLVDETRKKVEIPVIASVHCVSAAAWPDFAKRLESAGAHALELNAFVLPSDPDRTAGQIEQLYGDLAKAVRDRVDIPVALKLGSYFSGLANTARQLSKDGVAALTLFNRFFSTDIDIDSMELKKGPVLSNPDEFILPLRWISLLHGRVDCDLSATTGVHDAATVIKLLLAGATTVQVVSALYKNGVDYITTLNQQLFAWMEEHEFETVDAFRGLLSHAESDNPAAWERVQFMKFSAGVE